MLRAQETAAPGDEVPERVYECPWCFRYHLTKLKEWERTWGGDLPHVTANGTTTQNATDYCEGAKGAAVVRVDAVLRRAERVVRSLAPSPSTPSDDQYKAAAADTELAAFEHLWQRPSYLKREDWLDGSATYADDGALAGVVRDAMGAYYAGEDVPSGGGGKGEAAVFNVSDEPLF